MHRALLATLPETWKVAELVVDAGNVLRVRHAQSGGAALAQALFVIRYDLHINSVCVSAPEQLADLGGDIYLKITGIADKLLILSPAFICCCCFFEMCN